MRIKQRDAALAEADLPALFGRQSTDCTSGSNFYRCALNNFAGCCTVDPCALTSGCPDKGSNTGGGNNNNDDDDDDKNKDDPGTGINTGNNGGGGTPSTSTPPTNNDRTSAPPNSTPTPNLPETTTKTTAIPVTTTDSSGQIVTTVIETTITEAAGPLETGAGGIAAGSGSGSGNGGSGSGSDSGGKKLSTGAIAGIAVGAFLLLALLALLFLLRRRRKNARGPAQADFPPPMVAAATIPTIARDDGAASPGRAPTPSTLVSTPQVGYGDAYAAFGIKAGDIPPAMASPSTVASYRGSRNGDPRLSHASYVSSLASDTLPPGSPAPYARHTPPGEAYAAAAHRHPGAPPFVSEMDATPAPFRGSEMDATPAPLRVSEMDAAPAPLRASELPANGSPLAHQRPLAPVAEDASDPRASLAPTGDERNRQHYITSWSTYEGGPGGGR